MTERERISIHNPELTPREKTMLEESRSSWAVRENLEKELLRLEAEERKRRRLAAKKRADDFVESHHKRSTTQHSENKTPEEIVIGRRHCTLGEAVIFLEKFGIRREPNGLYRVRPPWRRDIGGLWVKGTTLNSFLESFFASGKINRQVEIASEFYGYLLGFEESRESFLPLANELGQTTKTNVLLAKLTSVASAIALVVLLVTTAHQKQDGPVQALPRTDTDAAAHLPPTPAPAPTPASAPSAATPAATPAAIPAHSASPTVTSTAPTVQSIPLKQDDRIWNIAVRLLRKQDKPFQRQDIIAKTRQICEINSIRAPELGITDGHYDARHLEVGFPVTIPPEPVQN